MTIHLGHAHIGPYGPFMDGGLAMLGEWYRSKRLAVEKQIAYLHKLRLRTFGILVGLGLAAIGLVNIMVLPALPVPPRAKMAGRGSLVGGVVRPGLPRSQIPHSRFRIQENQPWPRTGAGS